jgi:hypothetical protein
MPGELHLADVSHQRRLAAQNIDEFVLRAVSMYKRAIAPRRKASEVYPEIV